MSEYNVPLSTIVHWMSTLRNLPDNQRYRALESFWDTQLAAKVWIIEQIKNLKLSTDVVYIFGGWTGVLSSLLLKDPDIRIEKIYSIDIDPWCKYIAESMCNHDSRFSSVTADMAEFEYQERPSLIINTSTEHVYQHTYNLWYNNIPTVSDIIIQGNNFASCPEHVRCAISLEHFLAINNVSNSKYSGCLENSQYTRYMGIFAK